LSLVSKDHDTSPDAKEPFGKYAWLLNIVADGCKHPPLSSFIAKKGEIEDFKGTESGV
jgi:hypothetical protein